MESVLRKRCRWMISALCWAYALLVLAVWIYLRNWGDRTWIGTIAIFSPRWVILLPLILLAPLALFWSRRSLWILAASATVGVFAVMGLCIPLQMRYSPKPADIPIRIMTCNVHGRTLDPQRLKACIAQEHPDIIIMQEWLGQFQNDVFGDGDWNVEQDGEHCVATKYRIDLIRRVQFWAAVRYTIQTPAGRITILNVHLSSPHTAMNQVLHSQPAGKPDLEKNILQRQAEAETIHDLASGISGPLLIAGDFNLAFDSPIFEGNFANISDAFEQLGFGFGWTYRVKWTSVRIDHILYRGGWILRDCRVGPDIGSPHRPVIADFYLPGGQW